MNTQVMDGPIENQVWNQTGAAHARSTSNVNSRTSSDVLAYGRQQRYNPAFNLLRDPMASPK